MVAALFDADGTLYAAQFGYGLMKYAREHGRKWTVGVYYLSLVPVMLSSKLKLSGEENLHRTIIARLAWMIKGWDRVRVSAAFDWVVNDYLLPTTRFETTQKLQDHLKQGHKVLIVSGMFSLALKRVADHFGVADYIGTEIEFTNDRCTGRIIPPVLKGVDKLRFTKAYFNRQGYEIDWGASYAYGDSFTDQDLLSLVGNPTVVYPDPELHALARARGWQILAGPSSPDQT